MTPGTRMCFGAAAWFALGSAIPSIFVTTSAAQQSISDASVAGTVYDPQRAAVPNAVVCRDQRQHRREKPHGERCPWALSICASAQWRLPSDRTGAGLCTGPATHAPRTWRSISRRRRAQRGQRQQRRDGLGRAAHHRDRPVRRLPQPCVRKKRSNLPFNGRRLP